MNVGERTNVTGSAKFRKLVTSGDAAALDVARAIRWRTARRSSTSTWTRACSIPRMVEVPQPRRRRARHRPRAGDGRFLEVPRHRGRPEMHPGQGHRELDLHEGGRGEVHRAGEDLPRLRRRRRRDGVRRAGPGRHASSARSRSAAAPTIPHRAGRLPARGHHLRSERLRGRHRHRGANGYGVAFIEATRSSARRCRTRISRAACRTCPSPSAATSPCARRCTRCSSSTPSARHGHGHRECRPARGL